MGESHLPEWVPSAHSSVSKTSKQVYKDDRGPVRDEDPSGVAAGS